MQFAVPSTKSSRSAPLYSARSSSRSSLLRPLRLRPVLIGLAGLALVIYLLSHLTSGRTKRKTAAPVVIPEGTPPVVLVTAWDRGVRDKYGDSLVRNREKYAAQHGYGVFAANRTAYDLSDPPSPQSWAKVPAMRHAMTAFPHTEWFFYLDQFALIMRPDISLHEQILAPERIEASMLADKPVVPPDSVIRTYRNTRPGAVDAIFSQDGGGLGASAFFVRRGAWARYFLDAWFDPLYRSYNFQKAEAHALEHLVQWHGTVLLKFILVPQRLFNAYVAGDGERYADGDFVANLVGCDGPGSGRSCEGELRPLAAVVEKRYESAS